MVMIMMMMMYHLADDIFKCIFLYENFWITNKISLKYVPDCLIDNKSVLVQVMACHLTVAPFTNMV